MGLDNGPIRSCTSCVGLGLTFHFCGFHGNCIYYTSFIFREQGQFVRAKHVKLLNFHFDALMDPDPKILGPAKNLAFFF